MALFPGSADDALNASVQMLIELRNYNIGRVNAGYPPIKIGIGLNTGNLMLGTIGGKNRMDGTVISDSVNIASRLESLTKELFIPLIVSDSVVQKLQTKEKFSLREIDDVVMRGKSQSTLIYECFDSDETSLKEAKLKNQKQYNLALAEFRNKNYAKAKELFIECERNCPEDSILFIYINRCKERLA